MTFPVLSANGPSGYNLTRSLRFRSSASAYLNRTPASASNRTTWTWSAWFKRGILGASPILFSTPYSSVNPSLTYLSFSSDTISFGQVTSSATVFMLSTTQVLRDPSAWYHIIAVCDTTNATSTDRVRLYINGVRVTAFSTATYPAQNTTTYVNTTVAHQIGHLLYDASSIQNFDGYMAEINFVDGQALTPSSFGSTNPVTGVWQPAKYAGTYGTNGFYLPFTNTTSTTTLGNDFSGNGNNWTTNNISLTPGVTYDSMTDVPTLTSATAANFATLNPLVPPELSTTFNDGNLRFVGAGAVVGSMGMGAKTYVEMIPASAISVSVGVGPTVSGIRGGVGTGIQDSVVWFSSGPVFKDGGGTAVATYATFTTNDVCAFTFDPSNRQVTFYKNNVLQGSQTVSGTQAISFYGLGNTSASADVNFGQRPFAYTPPSGFLPLNTFNLPSSTIQNGASFMAATLATGNNSTQVITNTVGSASFQPDFVWMKIRSTSENHIAYDSVRGVQNYIVPNLTLAEGTSSQGLTSFNSNGFTLGNINPNYTGSPTFVAWQWKAGGTAVTNTAGSITSTVSANTTSGFSVVTYTGTGANATVGHGLNVTPAIYIVKRRDSVANWVVAPGNSVLFGGSFYLQLNTFSAVIANSNVFTSYPNSTILSFGTSTDVNASGGTYVAYCFAQIAGFSAIGSYTGNGSTDGPFIYTGFRPRWLMIKRTDAVSNWFIRDTARSPANASTESLFPNLSNAEISGAAFDILSNGFKPRSSASGVNGSGETYIYACFAENPFKNALAR